MKNTYSITFKELVSSRINLSLLLIICVLVLGITGFYWIEDYSIVEAIYMTVITVSTVGYVEVKPLSDVGRIFTSLLIVSNLIAFTYAFSTLTSYIYDGNLLAKMHRNRMNRKIEELSQHVVVCGYGRIGRQVCYELFLENSPFVVIESKPEVIAVLKEEGRYLYLHGEATDDAVLKQARLQEANALIATLPSDSDNVYITLAAREMNPNLSIISRVTHEMSDSKLRRAGCNHTVLPEKISGSHMAALVSQPDLYRFVNYITEPGNSNLYSEQLRLPHGADYTTLRQIDAQFKTGVNVIGLLLPDGRYVVNPDPDMQIPQKAILFFLGNESQIKEYKSLVRRPE